MTDARGSEAWGTEIVRRPGPIPFKVYEPRHHHVLELLRDMAPWADRDHLVQGDRRITFADLSDAVDRVAARLWESGLRPGDRLMILAHNSPEWVVSLWAAIRVGAIPALGNPWWGGPEVAHTVDRVEPRFVVADARRSDLLPDDFPVDRRLDVATVRSWVDDTSSPVEAPPEPVADEDDPAVIIFTAGTTGFPKPVVLAHRSIISNLHGLLAISRRLPTEIDRSKPGAVILQSGPMFHIGGLQSLLLAQMAGNRLVFLSGRFNSTEVLDLIEREGVIVWGAIPTMASRVLEDPTIGGRDLGSVRSISMGGMPVLPELTARLRTAFPGAERGMSTIYGMTELGGTVASASGKLMAEHPLTSGRPMPVADLRIADPDERGIGEIQIRTPGQMNGYWGGGSTTDVIDEEGFVHTGDLGRFDGDLLWVTGRSKDIIIRGGENIAAAHVEQALLQHPDVAVVAVLGLPDPDLGEKVGAVVQLRSGATPDIAALAAWAGEHLARFEVPADWWIRDDEMPMSDAGKVEKHKLRDAWLAR